MNKQFPQDIAQAAESLGYTQKDFYPMSILQLDQQCLVLTKNMQPKQKQFYLQRKMVIFQAKRQRIMRQIQVHARLERNKKLKFQQLNPKLQRIFSQYQKQAKGNQRYNVGRSKGLESSQSKTRKKYISNTIDFGKVSKLSGNESSYSKSSECSRKSVMSKVSNKSNRLSQSANSSRLSQVRLKQKQVQRYKKSMLQEKLRRDRLKFLKAQENSISKSRKVKVRSQIFQKIVKQNKQQIDIMKKFGMSNHLQNLKFKLMKNQFQRQNKLRSFKIERSKNLNSQYVNLAHRQIQEQSSRKHKYRYEQKIKYSNQWKKQYNSLKRQSLLYTHQQNKNKTKWAQQRFKLQQREQIRLRQQIILFQNKKLNEAQMRRDQCKLKRKLSGIQQQVKKQIVNRNKKAVQSSHSMRSKALTNHRNEKIKEIGYNQNVKRKPQNSQLDISKTIGYRQSNQIKGIRQSFTSANSRNAIFNTIFQ